MKKKLKISGYSGYPKEIDRQEFCPAKNPCRDCSRLSENKNDPICMRCNLRVEYDRSMGGINDMQPLVGLNGGGQTVSVGADYDAGKEYQEVEETKKVKRKYTKMVKPEIVHGPAPLYKENPYTILIDLSETPELYHKLAEREAVDIIMNALR